MKVSVVTGSYPPEVLASVSDALIVPIDLTLWDKQCEREQSKAHEAFSPLLGYEFVSALERARTLLNRGEPLVLRVVPALSQKCRLLLVIPRVEQKKLAGADEFRLLAQKTLGIAEKEGCASIALLVDLLPHRSPSGASVVESFVEAGSLALYRFDECRSTPSREVGPEEVKLLTVFGTDRLSAAIRRGQQIAVGRALARDIILLPPNRKKPADLAKRIEGALQPFSDVLTVSILDRAALQVLGANGILAVGGPGEPVLLKIEYHPPSSRRGRSRKPIVLVGKGVTFDTGGYWLKPPEGQRTMKADCGGAAAVVGTMRAIAALQPRTPVVAFLPLVENLINEMAMLSTDVVTMLDGTTVEVINTDAEGRLILADALTLASRENPRVIIDIATLTGAVQYALGSKIAGVFSRTDSLAGLIQRAGRLSDEPFWRLPLAEQYEHELRGGIADLKNIGTGKAGAVIAALFLNHFVPEGISWAHLDIAGVVGDELAKGKAPGFGVGTLTRFILNAG